MLLALTAGSAWSREAATPSECQAAASKPAVASALSKAVRDPEDLRARVALADAWSDAGCYNEAVSVLQSAVNAHPGIAELETRLRVAKSLVGEERFFDDLERADRQARLKRDAFRCDTLADLDACNEAVRLKPDDPEALLALGDALMRANRPSEALHHYRHAETRTPGSRAVAEKIRLAEAALPPGAAAAHVVVEHIDKHTARAMAKSAPRRYSNASPEGQSH